MFFKLNKHVCGISLSINSTFSVKELGKECWHIQPTCAITGDGLEEGFSRLVEMMSGKRKVTKNNILANQSHGSSSALNNNLKKSHSSTKVFRKVQRSHSHHY